MRVQAPTARARNLRLLELDLARFGPVLYIPLSFGPACPHGLPWAWVILSSKNYVRPEGADRSRSVDSHDGFVRSDGNTD